MLGHRFLSTKTVLAGLVVLAVGVAGCMGASGDEVPTFDSYEQAKQAPGTVWEANNTDSPIELRLLYPSDTTVKTGEHHLVFLLYDSESDEPVEGIEFESQDSYDEKCTPAHSFCAEMPEMGHGTQPEESPEHVGHGVYEAKTTFSMPGYWRVNVNPMIDGDVVEYDIDLTAEGEGDHMEE